MPFHTAPAHGFEPQQQISKISKQVREKLKSRSEKRRRLRFGLHSQVRFLFPVTAEPKSAPFCTYTADHPKRRLRVVARPLPIPSCVHQPQPRPRQGRAVCDGRKGDDAFVLVTSEELEFDSATLEV